jgi:hypothetical protein
MLRYTEKFRQSIDDPERFWGGAVEGIDWYRQPAAVLDGSSPPFYRWFSGGVLSTCFNAVDRLVRGGRGGQAALIYDSPVAGASRAPIYRQLLDEVARFAGVLRGLGTGPGDVINVAGHRLSTGEMEEVLAGHPAVAECAVVGVNDQLKGQVPRGFVVLKAGIDTDPDVLSAELVELIRDQIGPVAALRRVDITAGLPKPARARYCATPCAASPTATTSPYRPPSKPPRSSKHFAPS